MKATFAIDLKTLKPPSNEKSVLLKYWPIFGAIFENWVVSEIRRTYTQNGLEPPLWYYRDRDGAEIDLVVERDGHLHPIEIKKTGTPKFAMTASFRFLDKAPLPRGTGAIVCMAESIGALSADKLVFPAWGL